MPLNPIYYAAMFAIHLGLFWALAGLLYGAWRRRWALTAFQTACTVALLVSLVDVYAVVPALWWPDGLVHFLEHVLDCLWAAGLSLLGHLVVVFGALKKRRKATA